MMTNCTLLYCLSSLVQDTSSKMSLDVYYPRVQFYFCTMRCCIDVCSYCRTIQYSHILHLREIMNILADLFVVQLWSTYYLTIEIVHNEAYLLNYSNTCLGKQINL